MSNRLVEGNYSPFEISILKWIKQLTNSSTVMSEKIEVKNKEIISFVSLNTVCFMLIIGRSRNEAG